MSASRSPRGVRSFVQGVVCALFVTCATPSLALEPSLRSPRLQALSRSAAAGEDRASSTFWLEVARRGTPLIELLADGVMLLTFVVRANGMPDERAPGIYGQLGDTGGPMPAKAALQRLEGTDVWYRTYEMSDRARFSYHVVRPRRDVADPQAVGEITVEGAAHELFVDPLNPRTWVNGWMRLLETGELDRRLAGSRLVCRRPARTGRSLRHTAAGRQARQGLHARRRQRAAGQSAEDHCLHAAGSRSRLRRMRSSAGLRPRRATSPPFRPPSSSTTCRRTASSAARRGVRRQHAGARSRGGIASEPAFPALLARRAPPVVAQAIPVHERSTSFGGRGLELRRAGRDVHGI